MPHSQAADHPHGTMKKRHRTQTTTTQHNHCKETGSHFFSKMIAKPEDTKNHTTKQEHSKQTRAEVDGKLSQIPAFLSIYNLYFGANVTQNVAQYLLHKMTYAPVKFEVVMANG